VIAQGLVLFQRALQRVLVLSGEIHDLGHLRLGHLIRIHAAHPHPPAMHVQHDAGRLLSVLVKEPLENVDDEFHWRVVVV